MSECLKCKYCGRLEPLPRGDPSRLQSGQWGMLARGLVGCSIPGPGGYQRFRSVESKDSCPLFNPEEDASRVEARYRTVKLLRAAFAEWITELRNRRKKK
nr:MAG TPA_asm: hypothetical protein [Caudoviricetes sp.]